MQHGDLSSEVVPKILIVFEGAIGHLPPDKEASYQKFLRKQRWVDALYCWSLDEQMLRKIWDLSFRHSLTVEIITFISQPFADVLAARMDEEDMPVHRVWHTTPAKLSRQLAYMPDVSAVYDPDEAHVFTYGARGRVVTDASQLGG
jgi:hypothetical protein